MTSKNRGPIVNYDRLYVPVELVKKSRVREHYELWRYHERTCRSCEFLDDRHGPECEECPAFLGVIRMWGLAKGPKRKRRKRVRYITVPNGDLKAVQKNLKIKLRPRDVEDRRAAPKFHHKIKFTGRLYEGEVVRGKPTANQKDIVRQWMKKRYGIIEAPPRTGKTVIATAIMCELGVRVLVVLHQEDLLRNFLKSIRANTNIKKLEKKAGRPLVGIVNTVEEMDHLEIALVTYQKFIRDSGEERVARNIRGKRGLIVLDEGHLGAARAYDKFLNRLDCRYKLLLTATPERKDGLDVVVKASMGPVTVVSDTVALQPRIELLETKIKFDPDIMWSTFLKHLTNDEARNKIIVDQVFKDLDEHPGIIIATDRRQQLFDLVETINKEGRRRVKRALKKEGRKAHKKMTTKYPRKLAVGFFAEAPREETLKAFDSGNSRVLISIGKMIKAGIDLFTPTCVYVQIPTSNGPQIRQFISRVATPDEGKRQPVARLFVDECPQSIGCMRAVYRDELGPNNGRFYQIDRMTVSRINAVGKYKTTLM